ncbi:hypothetical protein SLS62_004957 [Diatrype stigma]|uniref:Ubiquitin 3 binding protein But2 C-terminal domain-containing protein n=1 Tax=Diatrype stigma TaxID=117547 RepID=A0AAN9V3V6_9PEZI
MTIAARADVGCGFHLRVTGGAAAVDNPFPVGQLDSGQCRAGSAMAPSLFTWFGDAFVDQQGRGCWWTPPTSVLQCDPLQAQPSHGFVIGCNGTVSYNDQPTFWSCQTGDDDQVNIYTQPSGANCSEIALVVDSCIPTCIDGVPQSLPPAPPPPPSSSSPDTSLSPSSTSSSSSSSSDSSLSSSSSSSLSSSPPPEATSPPGPSPTSSPTVETPAETTTANTDTTTTAATTTTTNTSSSSTGPSVPPSVTPFLSSDTTTATSSTNTASTTSNDTASSSSSSSSSFTPPVPLPSPPPTPSSCPMDVVGDGWEFPHLMVPVDRANPSTAYGPSSFGQLSPNASTLYSFDIPATDGARTCSLFFAFPSTADVKPSEYTFTFTPPDNGGGGGGGGGEADFAFLADPAAPFVTWDTMPPVAADLGAVELRPGNRYVISSFPCPAGRRISFAMREPPDGIGSGGGGGADTCLYYFQDIVPVPFGLYISKC